MVAAAWQFQYRAQGRSRGTGREGAKSSVEDHEPKQAADQEETKHSREATGGAGRTQAVETGQARGAATRLPVTLDRLLHFSPSLVPPPQNDLPSHTEVVRNSRTQVQSLAHSRCSLNGTIAIISTVGVP